MPGIGKLRRVFVVDDEPLIASTLAMILANSGFNAIPFSLPLEALMVSQSEAPDLLISDVMMPLLSGFELAIQVQEICPKCKVLLFSGQVFESTQRYGNRFEILPKPVHPRDLLEKIQSLTEEAPPWPSARGIRDEDSNLRIA